MIDNGWVEIVERGRCGGVGVGGQGWGRVEVVGCGVGTDTVRKVHRWTTKKVNK